MKILLIQDLERPHHAISPEQEERIRAIDPGIELVVCSSTQLQEVSRHMEDADVLAGILRSIPQIHDLKNLKWIHPFSAGVDWVLTPEVKDSNVLVGNCSGIHATPIAEHVLGVLLVFTRRFYDTFENQRRKVWERQRGATELKGKTVLIAGLGNIGKEVARVVSCVGARVTALDRKGQEKPASVEMLYSDEQWADALGVADFVVLALPLTVETRHLFDMEKFRIMKKTAVLVNVARGGLVHEQELIRALQEDIIAGAALDVMEEEPLPQESPLWEMKNVVITPHHSGISEKYMERAVAVFCENLKAYLEGKRLPNQVDKQKGY